MAKRVQSQKLKTLRHQPVKSLLLPEEKKAYYDLQGEDWKTIEQEVFKLQVRIYHASCNGDFPTLRKLQKLLLNNSRSAKMLAIYKLNKVRSLVKNSKINQYDLSCLKAHISYEIVEHLRLTDHNSKPVRGKWIPKPEFTIKCPLNIPSIYNQVLQTLVKFALEPEWEGRFNPNIYGFRPNKSCHDTIKAIFNFVQERSTYVLKAEITGFDSIHRLKLLEKINTFPSLKRQINAWLQTGIFQDNPFSEKVLDKPMDNSWDNAISPLLANIALHGLENSIEDYFNTQKSSSEKMIRYGDELVVFHHDSTLLEGCIDIIEKWLQEIGLKLNKDKTKIIHTLNIHEENSPGFDFIGFHIRQFPIGKHKRRKDKNGNLLTFETIITPSKDEIKKHYRKIAQAIESKKADTQENLLKDLNPKIEKWCQHYRYVMSQKSFSRLDYLVDWKIWRWCKRRHHNKNNKWLKNKYYQWVTNEKKEKASVFGTNEGLKLVKHTQTKRSRYFPSQADKSPYG